MADEQKPSWPILGMTVDEAAKVLRVNERTIRDMISARPDFPARLMGGKGGKSWRIDYDALKRWLDGRDMRTDDERLADNPATKADFREHLPEVQKMFKLKKQPEAQA